MRMCIRCFKAYGTLADYCGHCGVKLPEVELSCALREEKREHNKVICTGELGHALQSSFNDDQQFCTACGNPLLVSPPRLH